ncbi:MAG: hypothetical protein JO257_09265 [Deltaproteobacteria bacterium]|nr:hypothetical protein [Deltaproteobacteria bacterium]
MSDFEEISSDDLAQVAGGGLFSWLDNIYKSIVFNVGGKVGGTKLAEKMYGKHTTDRDRARAQAAMHKFLAGGHKLPKGVPNIFGG